MISVKFSTSNFDSVGKANTTKSLDIKWILEYTSANFENTRSAKVDESHVVSPRVWILIALRNKLLVLLSFKLFFKHDSNNFLSVFNTFDGLTLVFFAEATAGGCFLLDIALVAPTLRVIQPHNQEEIPRYLSLRIFLFCFIGNQVAKTQFAAHNAGFYSYH